MKKLLYMIFALALTCNLSACGGHDIVDPPTEQPGNNNGENRETPNPSENIENMKLKITIGDREITATFVNNETAKDFASLLPLTVNLNDYASTEKVFDLSRKLSTTGAPAGVDPEPGDITYYSPWGNIAIFYRDFGYSNGLVKIARIDSGIEVLQVPGSINNVKFELIEKD